jgi:hypothetical protein
MEQARATLRAESEDGTPDATLGAETSSAPARIPRTKRGAIHADVVAALKTVVPLDAPPRWTGPVQLRGKPKGRGVGAVTEGGIGLAIERRGELVVRFIETAAIESLSFRNLRTRVHTTEGDTLDITTHDDGFSNALLGMNRTPAAPAAAEPALPSAPMLPASAPLVPEPLPAHFLVAPVLAVGRHTAVVATEFAPTAYAEHEDGVLRAVAWPEAAGPPPPVGTQIGIERTDGGWIAVWHTLDHSKGLAP